MEEDRTDDNKIMQTEMEETYAGGKMYGGE